MKHHRGFKKFTHGLIAVLLLFSMSFAVAPQAHAQLAVVASTPGMLAKMTIQDILKKLATELKDALISSLSAEMVNLLTNMANKLAYNTAVWVASGGNAESPLVNVLPPKDYFKYAGARVLSDIYNEVVVENFDDGMWPTLNIYISTDPIVLQAVRSGIRSFAVRPEISFEYPSIKANWTSYLASLSSSDLAPEEKSAAILAIMTQAFDPSVNELAAIAQVEQYVLTTTLSEASAEEEQLTANDGFMAVSHYITGQVETPASLVKQEVEDALQVQKELPFEINASLLANSDSLISIGLNAGTVFTNTLFSQLMSKLQGGLFEDVIMNDANPFDPNTAIEYSRDRIAQVFRSVTSFKPLEITDYSLLSELATCPSTFRGSSVRLYNCAIDSSFVSAVALSRTGDALSVQEAIDEGYIKGSWPLIPSADTARNQDTKCYTYGFCYSNLVKLRKARIIPVGWELAAESEHNSDTDPVTLQEAIDGFYDCNADGELDDEHPWCHLVDPNWILKFPETQCRTLAYGQILSSSGTDERAEECVDIQSCISQDSDGNCDGGYGYCVREKNIWQFRGEECPEEYASCMTFETQIGTEVDYLTNTLDYGDCSASNMGCMWYATQKEEKSDGSFDWPVIDSVAVADLLPDAYANRVYFNSEVSACDAADAGCVELYEREDDSTLNLIANSSFEADADEDGWPDGWALSANTVYSTDGTKDRTGNDALNFTGETVTKYGIELSQTRYYTLSVYATAPSGDYATADLIFEDENGNPVNMSYQSINGSCSSSDCLASCGIGSTNNSVRLLMNPESASYIRFECVFTTPTLTDRSLDIHARLELTGDLTTLDDIMLEQNADSTIYVNGYNNDLDSVYLKVAPDYLGCTGSDDDPDVCDGYARMCSEQEAGCAQYTPVNGDPSVTAVVSALDECPLECDGYDTYRQEATVYEPYGDFPLYFIPDSADECDERAVGCTEFTNLTTEEREYYTYLRTCVTELQARANTNGDNASVFYTWEGSDEEGFQLRTWTLLESDLDDVGYNDYEYNNSGETDTRPGQAPCTNWSTDADGITCHDDTEAPVLVFDEDNADCDEHADILTNPDCREFYDYSGGIHYREWSKTVTVNDACASYRLTDMPGDTATEWEAACDASQGYYDSTAELCRFYGYSEESTECRESDNGCRQFTGGRSANSRQVLEDLFEAGSLSNWSAASASLVTLSNESVAVDGHSLKSEGQNVWSYLYAQSSACATEGGCASTTGVLGGSCTVEEGDLSCGALEGELFAGKTYTLTFWAKGEVDVQVGFDVAANTSSLAIDSRVDGAVPTAELTSEWTYYSFGPFDMNEDDYPAFGNGTVLLFDPSGSGDFYIDNVVLREGEDELTLIKDSWVTPAVCDQTWEGVTSPQEQLGCQGYTDQEGEMWYLKSFRDLCGEDAVGCKDYYTTEQSDSEYASVHNATCYNVIDSTGAVVQATSRTSCHLYTNAARTAFDTNSPVLCTIIAGETSCKFDSEDWFIPQATVSDLTNFPELYHIYYGPDATVAKADGDLYLIYDEELECSSSVAGCTEMGEPSFTNDLTVVEGWESVYFINDSDEYDTILCDDEELFCEAFETDNEGTWYFKRPLGHTCEYKSDVTIGGTTYSGWFQDGTSEFCYGQGYCSGNTDVSCTYDAECMVEGYGTCTITDGAYLIGGDKSGIWRNGDVDYAGWVGLCETEYNGCTAFEDTMDVDDNEFYTAADGEIYYYIDNDQITDSSLLSSQRCNGQVSQKEGCTLFYDNGDISLDYNASASYVVSTHADELVGESPYALVDPVDCTSSTTSTITLPDGSTFDPCESRCVYDNEALGVGTISSWYQRNTDDLLDYSTTSGTACTSDADCSSGTCNTAAGYCGRPLTYSADEVYTVGQSCYEDVDCPAYDGALGNSVQGSCETQLLLGRMGSGVYLYDSFERLENDTNRVVRVNQDRVCSEWLSCSSSYSIWDADAGKYRTICDGVDLCTEYSAEGHPSFCSAWDADDAALVLDEARYVSRDISWYGEEYSGYAVPNIFPLQHLEQVDIAPPAGYCDLSENYEPGDTRYDNYHGDSCEVDADCYSGIPTSDTPVEGLCVTEQAEDYRLGYVAGSCDENHAEDCAVGYCTDDGSACTSDGDCEGAAATCVPGVCYDLSETVCESDADCADDETCMTGVCADEGDYCSLADLSCAGATETCFTSAAYEVGSCYRNSCFLAMDGDPFDTAQYEGQVCRANPEVNSPFGNNIVTDWTYIDTPGSSSRTEATSALSDISLGTSHGAAVPRTVKASFSMVETCAPGEDCTCSYTKLSNSGGVSAYVEAGHNVHDELDIIGICSEGSSVAGALCREDEDCQDSEGGSSAAGTSATCDRITTENTLYGLNGYCLERDSGLNIEGDEYLGACLTWFPVDQLAGSTDLYAKYTAAGYSSEEYYCGYTSMFTDFYTTGSPAIGYDLPDSPVACAETNDSGSACNDHSSGSRYHCTDNAGCPSGYYAVVGQCLPNSESGDYGIVYAEDYCMESTRADCPYVCVPYGSYHVEEDIACSPETIEENAEIDGLSLDCSYNANFDFTSDEGNTYHYSNTVCKALGTDYEEFDTLVDYLHQCVLPGISVDHEDFTDLIYKDYQDECGPGADGGCANQNQGDLGFLNLYLASFTYPACSVLLQTSDASDGNYAWTDKLLGTKLETIDTMGYSVATANAPYGASISPEGTDLDQFTPARIAVCDDDGELTPPAPYSEGCEDEYQDSTTLESPGALSYIDFSMLIGGASRWDSSSYPNYATFYTAEGIGNVVNRVNQIFAKVVNIWHWNLDPVPHTSTEFSAFTGNYEEIDSGTLNYTDGQTVAAYEALDDVRAEGVPPSVWSVDVDQCGSRYCAEGREDAITLNNQDTGDFETDGGFFRATLKFFAAAYKEQLPIRRVIVQWGDGDESGSADDENYYKNHRGLNGTSLTESICDTGDEWGMTPDSCDPNYFTYQHAYRCSAPELLPTCSEDEDGHLVTTPCTTDGESCTYQPRVHLRDNWGWCTGECSLDGAEGCYAGDSYGLMDVGSAARESECAYEYYDEAARISSAGVDPWIYYDGTITVSP